MKALQPLEDNLNDLFVKSTPPLPDGGKKALIAYLPWINLVLAFVSLYTVWVLWHWAQVADQLINYTNSLSVLYGGQIIANNRMSAVIWISLALMAVQGALYVMAFQATRDRKKSGWDLMFYAGLVNVAYAIVVVFSNYGDVGNLVGSLIGSAIGLYLLFQIRASYLKPVTDKKA